MASMHSQRTQCCCCAVGVFTSMFGIFMLSAGICIVLNVNYMEVDTGGLPPELHNEEGKKVVGIILICVALGTLGVSATVAVVYFVICNRKPKPTPTALANQKQPQHSNGSIGRNHRSGERTPGNETPGSRTSRTPGNETPGSRTSRTHAGPNSRLPTRNPGQPSTMPTRKTSLQHLERPGRSGSPQLSSRINGPVGASRYKSKRRVVRRQMYRSGLDTHSEKDEDMEMASSTSDVRSPQKGGGEASSQTSGSSLSADRQNTTPGAEASGHNPRAPPVIVVDAWTSNSSKTPGDTPMSEFDQQASIHKGQHRRHSQTDSGQLSYEVPVEHIRTNSMTSDPDRLDYSAERFYQSSEVDEEEEMQPPLSLPFNIDVVPDAGHQQNIFGQRDDPDEQGSGASTLSDTPAVDAGEQETVKRKLHPREEPLFTSQHDRAESRVSYNSVVSSEGELTGDAADMELLKEKMRQLLEKQDSNC